MPGRDIILNYPEAAALVDRHTRAFVAPLSETISIEDALGRCLAMAIKADRDQPPFDRSTRDGYAVRVEDLGASLRVIGQLRAGEPPFAGSIGPGEALEIMTGAPIPEGANAVLMVEHANAENSSPGSSFVIRAHAGRSLRTGDNIVPAGAEAKGGDTIVPARTRLTPSHIGAAASVGAAGVEVYVRPRVAILATGDELVEPGKPVLSHQVRNSNSYSLAAQVERAGGIAIRLPIARDSMESLQQALASALQADAMLLSGGVSMGKYDLVEQALATLEAEFFFTGVRIQPGKPLVFGRVPAAGHYFFGLPGNPVSTMVTFALFAAPLLRALGGEQESSPRFARARLATSFSHQGGTTRFLPARLHATWEGAEVTPVPWQGSGDLAATARANCFVVIPPDRTTLAEGDEVSVLLE